MPTVYVDGSGDGMGGELMSGGAEMPLDDDSPMNESEALNTCDTSEASAAREARRAQASATSDT